MSAQRSENKERKSEDLVTTLPDYSTDALRRAFTPMDLSRYRWIGG